MTLSGPPVRALVPYVPPKQKHPISALRRNLHRLSRMTDALFVRRKRYYISALLLAAFGILLGCYYASVQGTSVGFLPMLRASRAILPAMLFCGMTLFGVAAVPGGLVWFSFLFGCAAGSFALSTVRETLCLCLLLALYLSVLLFSVEAFLTALRSRSGWKNVFCCKSFLAFCLLFLVAYLLIRAAELLFLSFSYLS